MTSLKRSERQRRDNTGRGRDEWGETEPGETSMQYKCQTAQALSGIGWVVHHRQIWSLEPP